METISGTADITCLYSDEPAAYPTLGQVIFRRDRGAAVPLSQSHHSIDSHLVFLHGSARAEYFLTEEICLEGQADGLVWRGDENNLLISLAFTEDMHGGILTATQVAYTRLLGRIAQLGYPHLVRVWNYFAQINEEVDGLERYRKFCVGRFDAFAAQGLAEQQFPSACAIGHFGGKLVIYALASRKQPKHYENPLQQQAYCYPKEYGPRSPSFARATVLRQSAAAAKVFVSGTASVVGNQTLHAESVSLQLQETLNNLSHLGAHIVAEESSAQGQLQCIAPEILKVYVRNDKDLPLIEKALESAFPNTPTVYLHADICRTDLLLEIDGIWNLQTY